MFVAGIDENGLGPKLGPLVVTGALFETDGDGYEPSRFGEALEGATALGGARVADSKAVMSASAMGPGETTVLALASRLRGDATRTDGEFLEAFCHPPPSAWRDACPPEGRTLCFGPDAPLGLFGADLANARELGARLAPAMASAGVTLRAVHAEVLCPARFNRTLEEEGNGKARLDLAAFERRIRAFAGDAGEDALYLCGKVMNLAYYTPHMDLPRTHPLLQRSESKRASVYRFQDLGEVRFLLDGDRDHLPIAVASMFGKYVREIFMKRLNRFFAGLFPGHRAVSGYGDPVTRAFLSA